MEGTDYVSMQTLATTELIYIVKEGGIGILEQQEVKCRGVEGPERNQNEEGDECGENVKENSGCKVATRDLSEWQC